jgi:glucosyl-3-phosphoglycerate phosphatase
MYLLRHGQSFFNLHFTSTRIDPGIEDPELTELGIRQASAAAKRLAGVVLTRIIVSPYMRALQTAQPIIAKHLAAVEVRQEVRERAAFTCDIGSSPRVLAERFPQHEFTHLPERWWPHSETEAETVVRANQFRAALAARADSATTLLVSHWAFILALSGQSVENGELIEYDPAAH